MIFFKKMSLSHAFYRAFHVERFSVESLDLLLIAGLKLLAPLSRPIRCQNQNQL